MFRNGHGVIRHQFRAVLWIPRVGVDGQWVYWCTSSPNQLYFRLFPDRPQSAPRLPRQPAAFTMNAVAASRARTLDAEIASRGGIAKFRRHALDHLCLKLIIRVRASSNITPPALPPPAVKSRE